MKKIIGLSVVALLVGCSPGYRSMEGDYPNIPKELADNVQ